jgi:biopolymer transport protein ExbB
MTLFIFLQEMLQSEAVADTVNTANGLMEGDTGELTVRFIDLVMKGGWIMAILGLMSVVTIYIFIERYLVISRNSKQDKNFMNIIRDNIYDGKIDTAKELCKRENSPIARMIEKGLSRIGKTLE